MDRKKPIKVIDKGYIGKELAIVQEVEAEKDLIEQLSVVN